MASTSSYSRDFKAYRASVDKLTRALQDLQCAQEAVKRSAGDERGETPSEGEPDVDQDLESEQVKVESAKSKANKNIERLLQNPLGQRRAITQRHPSLNPEAIEALRSLRPTLAAIAALSPQQGREAIKEQRVELIERMGVLVESTDSKHPYLDIVRIDREETANEKTNVHSRGDGAYGLRELARKNYRADDQSENEDELLVEPGVMPKEVEPTSDDDDASSGQ